MEISPTELDIFDARSGLIGRIWNPHMAEHILGLLRVLEKVLLKRKWTNKEMDEEAVETLKMAPEVLKGIYGLKNNHNYRAPSTWPFVEEVLTLRDALDESGEQTSEFSKASERVLYYLHLERSRIRQLRRRECGKSRSAYQHGTLLASLPPIKLLHS